ncbi:TPA: pilus assembly protein [Legionella pneumophila]|nr:pilus assembly protein [Legionella pneumophila]HAU0349926.1 pilus assembly protein [Legionella pneumophila]HAU0353417.1 pilus assembly protein [Legionella pneumophila]HAU0359506.1 pilus assembly protein [Legionella pneumophila]HAU0368063.1 pilus assembly protein [Legionella pneumophila]
MQLKDAVHEKSILLYELMQRALPLLTFTALAMICLIGTCHADGTNYLSGMKSDVSATFGKNSDLPNYLYGAETLVAGFTWLKTKSPWIFIGLPLLMIFTHWGLGYVA